MNNYGTTQFNQKKRNNELQQVWQNMMVIANDFKVRYLASEFMLLAIVTTNSKCQEILKKYEITYNYVKVEATKALLPNCQNQTSTEGFELMKKNAYQLSDKYGCPYLATEHILLAILQTKCMAKDIIFKKCLNFNMLVNEITNIVVSLSQPARVVAPPQNNNLSDNNSQPRKSYIQKETDYPTIKGTVLEQFGFDLTEKARRGKLDPVIGRDKEISQIINTLSRRQKNNPLVVGEPGTGKTAVVEGLAQKIINGEVPLPLRDKILFSLDLTSIIAGAKMRGEFEQRFKEMMEFIQEDGNIILFIDEIHNLVSGAKSDGINASEILKPALARGEIQVVGATTINEYRKYIEKDPALERRFQPIMVEPPSVEDTIKIIEGLKPTFELHHRIDITKEAIVAAATLADRYIMDRFLPDKAIDLIDEAAARARIIADTPNEAVIEKENQLNELGLEIDYATKIGKDSRDLESKYMKLEIEVNTLIDSFEKQRLRGKPYIDGDDVAKVVCELTKIPVARLTETEADKLKNLENTLHKRVIGQDKAVVAVSKAIKRAMTGVQDPKRPIGTFLFAGPTGVGKTELSKALAETLFGNEDMLIRIDMSEYMESNSVAKLIGAPPGYVGYDEEGQLTEKVRRQPYSVVLFDEVEKAHRDVFNLFLQIFDDGRLTDSKGRLIDFKNTVIIMTSNVGVKNSQNNNNVQQNNSDDDFKAREELMNSLKRVFKPEFINRIDEIVQFSYLSKEDCFVICRLLVDGFKNRLAQRNIIFSCDDDVISLIVEKGYNAEFGARPLKRAIINMLEDEISERILSGEIRQGSQVSAFRYKGFIDFDIS